jgi:catechol 2,3-dioxygenase-like lactoylglutathione lyase family enzyme
MTLTNALATVAVRDIAAARDWYAKLFDRAPTTQPMQGLLEWSFSKGGWMQVFEDKDNAGHSSVTLAESDLRARLRDLEKKGIRIGPTSEGDKVSTAIVTDPDGNRIVFAQGKDAAHGSTG